MNKPTNRISQNKHKYKYLMEKHIESNDQVDDNDIKLGIKDIDFKHKNQLEIDDNYRNNQKPKSLENKYDNIEHDRGLRHHDDKFEVPPNLKKTFFMTLSLFIVGVVLLVLGFIEEIADSAPGVSIAMWVLSGIVIIPGGYYSYQFYLAMKARGEERDEILEAIPEI